MLVLGIALAGCVSSKYRMTGKEAKPAVPVEMKAGAGDISVTLDAVIAHDGPGSWKREAYWDEYVVRLENHGAVPVLIASAEVVGVGDLISLAGAAPWILDRQGHVNERTLRKNNILVAAGSTPDPAAVIAGGTLGVLVTPIAPFLTVSAVQGMLVVGGVALAAYAPVGLTSHFLVDPKHRNLVEQEFKRRCLVLPVSIGPGQGVTGSLFFALTPGPQRMIVRGQIGENPLEFTLDLQPFAGLHLKPPGKHQPPSRT